jgi:hypothetical protein
VFGGWRPKASKERNRAGKTLFETRLAAGIDLGSAIPALPKPPKVSSTADMSGSKLVSCKLTPNPSAGRKTLL